MTISLVKIVPTIVPGGEFFHFHLAFVTKTENEEEASIQLDMSPSYTDMSCLMRGIVLISYKEGSSSPSSDSADCFVFPIAGLHTTAGALCDVLLDQGKMDHYIFSNEGNGCRHWCATALKKLEQGGYVDAGATESFEKFEGDGHTMHGAKFPVPRIRGTFY